MAIAKMSSKDINDILEQSKDKINETNVKVSEIKETLSSKLMILQYTTEYINSQFAAIKAGRYIHNKKLNTLYDADQKQAEIYGSVSHAKFIKTPINIFNLITAEGNTFFRSDVKVAINDKFDDKYNVILKADSTNDKALFIESPTDTIKITIATNTESPLGDSIFNMIEIDSFLYDSYSIESIDIYKIDENNILSQTPMTIDGVKDAGKFRIILPEKVAFHKIDFNIKIKFFSDKSGKTIFPFGLKHIYFYEADFRNDSYVINEIKAEEPIDIIKNIAIIKTPQKKEEISLLNSEIKFYLDNNNGVLSSEVYVSTPIQRNSIARNSKVIYARIPIGKECITGIYFDIETK